MARSWITLSEAGDSRARTVDEAWLSQARWIVETFARPGERILDPCCGWGTTLVAACAAGHPCIGIDRDRARIAHCRERLADQQGWQVDLGDARQLPLADGTIDLAHLNPPYAPITSQQAYQDHLAMLDAILAEFARVLSPRGRAIITCENCRWPDGSLQPLAWDLAHLACARFRCIDERIICYPARAQALPSPLHSDRTHEYCLVCTQRC